MMKGTRVRVSVMYTMHAWGTVVPMQLPLCMYVVFYCFMCDFTGYVVTLGNMYSLSCIGQNVAAYIFRFLVSQGARYVRPPCRMSFLEVFKL